MKRFTAFLLCAALCLSPALAVGEEKFPAVNVYPGYADVKETDWFYDTAKLCYEIGLMTGTDKGFEPNKTLTGPECAALAARLREKLTGKPIPEPTPDPGLPWYQHYVDYLQDASQESGSSLYGLIKWNDPAEFEKPATRYDFLLFMALVADGNWDYFSNINTISYEDLPDVKDENDILQFYNWGILTGTDSYGTFAKGKTLTRAEAAAMAARMAKPELRKSFTPADYVLPTAGIPGDTVLFDNGVTARAYFQGVNYALTYVEWSLGDDFNWHAPYSGTTVLDWVKSEALFRCEATEAAPNQTFRDLDLQVYYSRLIDLMGGPLG